MKRVSSLLALLALLFPLRAAAMTLPYGANAVLSVLDLTDSQRALAEFLYTPVFNMEGHIELPQGTAYDDVSAAMACLMQDYPELFHLGKDFTVGYYRDTPQLAAWVEPTYRMSAGEAADARAVLYAQAYLIADASTDAEALHDTLCSMVTYGGDTDMRHTAVGALLQGQATCEGYAQALTLLYRTAGIPCGIITGTAVDDAGVSERHSWCIADDGDGFTLIDPTWNDQDALGLNTHWYYGLSTGQMAADHTPDRNQHIPLCDAHANWHDRHGYNVSSAKKADMFIRRLVAGETVNLRTGGIMYTALTDDLSTWLEHYNERNPDAPFYGAYRLIKCDAQMCIILQRVE